MFRKIAVKIRGVGFLQDVFDQSGALEGLQMQIQNADRRVGWLSRRQLFWVVPARKEHAMKQFVFVPPEIDKDKRGAAPLVDTDEANPVIVTLFIRQLFLRDFFCSRDELRVRQFVVTGDSVELHPPIADLK